MFKNPKIGIFIGIFDIVVSICFAILAAICLIDVYDKTKHGSYNLEYTLGFALTFSMSISVLVICLPIIIVSSLLIRGSLQRRHSLMVPWLVVHIIGLIFYITSSIVDLMHTHEDSAMIAGRCIGIVLEALIIYTIFNLYRDVRSTNIQNKTSGQVSYTTRQAAASRSAATTPNVFTPGQVLYPVLTSEKILVP